MTVKDYIKGRLGLWKVEIEDSRIILELGKLGITPDEPMDTQDLDRFFLSLLPELIACPSSISEGGFSISWNIDGMKAYYRFLAKKAGQADPFSSKIKEIKSW